MGERFAGPFGRLPPDVLRVVTASAGWLVCNCTGIHAARRRGSPVPADNLAIAGPIWLGDNSSVNPKHR